MKLTPEGWQQAEEAGRRIRSMLRPDDTIQLYISPYRRTRETTDGILRTLTSDDDSPSPFPRQSVRVWEEPRLREQDFGNFQPCSAAMERMWQERADYGHFFYRIPGGESAADAYDRISGFNESLWRSFSEEDFPSVCILVTHGLMTRVFLMKWYHWSVEYFEDLRNVSHCEMVIMKRSHDTGKYLLQNELRTWSELKRKAAEANGTRVDSQHSIPKKRWGGCPDGCTHDNDDYPKRPKRVNTAFKVSNSSERPPSASSAPTSKPLLANSSHENALISANRPAAPTLSSTTAPLHSSEHIDTSPHPTSNEYPNPAEEDDEAFPHSSAGKSQRSVDISTQDLPSRLREQQTSPRTLKPKPQWLAAGRDFGGSESGMATPTALPDTAGYGFPNGNDQGRGSSPDQRLDETEETHEEWLKESGMGTGARADALGDQVEEEGSDDGKGDPERVKQREKEDESIYGAVY